MVNNILSFIPVHRAVQKAKAVIWDYSLVTILAIWALAVLRMGTGLSQPNRLSGLGDISELCIKLGWQSPLLCMPVWLKVGYLVGVSCSQDLQRGDRNWITRQNCCQWITRCQVQLWLVLNADHMQQVHSPVKLARVSGQQAQHCTVHYMERMRRCLWCDPQQKPGLSREIFWFGGNQNHHGLHKACAPQN